MNHPTSKQPNPNKFHHNNRCLLPFHKAPIVGTKHQKQAIVTDRVPGQIIKSNDGKFTYRIGLNGALEKTAND